MATFTQAMISIFMKTPKYIALNPLYILAGFPLYLNSISSASVITPERFHSLAKKKVVNSPPAKKFHQSQLPEIPFPLTNSVTAKGVSAAKVVATIEIPAKYHGSFPPPKKKLFKSLFELDLYFKLIPNEIRKKVTIIAISIKAKFS